MAEEGHEYAPRGGECPETEGRVRKRFIATLGQDIRRNGNLEDIATIEVIGATQAMAARHGKHMGDVICDAKMGHGPHARHDPDTFRFRP